MNRLVRENLLGQFTKKTKIDMLICECCLVDKTTRNPYEKGTRTEIPLQLICFDICGPMSIRARYGAFYFITFIDDFTRYSHVYLISHKLETLDCFRHYINLVKNQLDKRLKHKEQTRVENIYQNNLKIYVMKRVLSHNKLFQGLHNKMVLLRRGIECS